MLSGSIQTRSCAVANFDVSNCSALGPCPSSTTFNLFGMAFFLGLSLDVGSEGVAPADAAAVVSVRHVFADEVL